MELKPEVKAYGSNDPISLSFGSPNVIQVRNHSKSELPFYVIFSRDFIDRNFYHEGARAEVYFEQLMDNPFMHSFPEHINSARESLQTFLQEGFRTRNIRMPDFNYRLGQNSSSDISGYHSAFLVPLRRASHTNTLLDLLGIPHPRHIQSFNDIQEEVRRSVVNREYRENLIPLRRIA